MYIPSIFEETRPEVLHELIEKYPFGVLFTCGKGGLDASHIPFVLNKDQGPFGGLHAHVARANRLWQDTITGDEVLVVFQAANAYISPGWYPSKVETEKEVPTWNFRVVHAYGRITIHDNDRYCRGLVARLTRTHEAGRAKPWKMTDSPKDFIDSMLKEMVGVEIEITRLIGKMKMGQNKQLRDIIGASQGLKAQGDDEVADVMLSYASHKIEQS
ncbi:transcriptional regulator [Bradyrhizobium sp. USDA 4518]